MANRTLRRPRNGAKGDALASGSGAGESEQPEPVPGNDDGDAELDGTEQVADGPVDDDAEPASGAAHVGVVEIDPGTLDQFIASGGQRTEPGDAPGEPTRKRRTRADAGTTRGTRKGKGTPQDITPLLTLVHTWAPIMLKIPELSASPKELETLVTAYNEFAKYHPVPEFTEKRMSEVNLVIALGMIYGTRLIAFGKRKQNERKKQGPQAVVQPMPFPSQQHVV